jgi:hypothetical protein
LVAPLALLIFVGSFLPIVGSIIFGALAVAITFVTQGWVLGVVLIAILIVDNQVEAHILQPFLVGRYVRLHPLAIAVSIASGTVLAGIYGAVLAVPVVAVTYAVLVSLATGGKPPPEIEAPGIESLGGDPPQPKKTAAKRTPAKKAPAKKAPAKKTTSAGGPRKTAARSVSTTR